MTTDAQDFSVTGLTRWFIVLAVMLVAGIEVLDMTIVNVALPHMMGALGANSEQITWVLTSYVVSAAIIMPLTGFLTARLGRKKLLMMSIVGFLISSMLCGVAQSLAQIVLFRTLQGVFGAALVPLSQAIMQTTFSKRELAKAMSIWGIGIMCAPAFGPTLGGYITEAWNWRWVFYINIPVCLLALLLTYKYIDESPKLSRKLDGVGLALMAIGIGSLQLFLDRGNSSDWFAAHSIQALCFIFLLSLSYFISRGLQKENNVVNLLVYSYRNYSIATLMLIIYSLGLFGTIAIQPIMLQVLMHYPPDTAGLVMIPRGLASALTMCFIPFLNRRYNTRLIIAAGIFLSGIGCYQMAHFSLSMGPSAMIIPTALQGVGMGLFFVPMTTLAFGSLPPALISEATGLYSFSRNLGTSIGISLLSTLLTRTTQVSWHSLGGHLQRTAASTQMWLEHSNLSLQHPATLGIIAGKLSAQANMIAFVDCYYFVAASCFFLLPFLLFFKKSSP